MGGRRHGAKVARAARRRQPPYRPDETKRKPSRVAPRPDDAGTERLLGVLDRTERKERDTL
jgi:hypothetical protein